MWLSKSLVDLFTISRDTVQELRVENSTLKATNAVLERELLAAKLNSDSWRLRVNQLEAERVQLIAKAYPGLQLPAPEITRIKNQIKDGFDLQALFEDLGDPPDTKSVA
jgi:hypothetical protein